MRAFKLTVVRDKSTIPAALGASEPVSGRVRRFAYHGMVLGLADRCVSVTLPNKSCFDKWRQVYDVAS